MLLHRTLSDRKHRKCPALQRALSSRYIVTGSKESIVRVMLYDQAVVVAVGIARYLVVKGRRQSLTAKSANR